MVDNSVNLLRLEAHFSRIHNWLKTSTSDHRLDLTCNLNNLLTQYDLDLHLQKRSKITTENLTLTKTIW